MGRAATETRNLRRGESKFLEQQRPPIPFDGSDRRWYWLTCGVPDPLIVRIQNRRRATTKSECAFEVLRRDVVICLAAQPHAKSPTVPSVDHSHVILKLMIVLGIERMPRRGRATVERPEHLNRGPDGIRRYLVTRPEKLKACLVHHIFREHRGLCSLDRVRGGRGAGAA